LKRHDGAIGYLESDHASTHPADEGTRVHMKTSRLGRSELDTRHLYALDHRLGSEGDLQQGVAQNGRRLRHRSEILARRRDLAGSRAAAAQTAAPAKRAVLTAADAFRTRHEGPQRLVGEASGHPAAA
jgi:hypothetical protein